MPAGKKADQKPTLTEELDVFRGAEPEAGIAIIVADTQAVKVLAAWSLFRVPKWVRPRGRRPPESDPGDLFEWLWAPVWRRIDFEDFARAAGMAPHTAELKLRMCVHARMAYPDGSLSEPAQRLLRSYVRSKVPRPRRQKETAGKPLAEET